MPLSEEDKDRVKVDYLEWSGGYGPDEPDMEVEDYLVCCPQRILRLMDKDAVRALLEEWKAELETASARANAETAENPVVWRGTLDAAIATIPVRVRRLGEDALVAERRNPAYAEDEGRAWEATDDETASLCYEQALLELLGRRGLPR